MKKLINIKKALDQESSEKIIENNEIDNSWQLDEIKIEFKRGWLHEKDPEKQEDRYEGYIEFMNGENESFRFKIRPDMAQAYIDLMASDIVKSADNLGERLKKSLGLS